MRKSANGCVNDFWLANGISWLQPITSKLLDTDVVAQKKKKSKEHIKSKCSVIELNLAVVELGNIVTMTSE